jgi:hypothetical protein
VSATSGGPRHKAGRSPRGDREASPASGLKPPSRLRGAAGRGAGPRAPGGVRSVALASPPSPAVQERPDAQVDQRRRRLPGLDLPAAAVTDDLVLDYGGVLVAGGPAARLALRVEPVSRSLGSTFSTGWSLLLHPSTPHFTAGMASPSSWTRSVSERRRPCPSCTTPGQPLAGPAHPRRPVPAAAPGPCPPLVWPFRLACAGAGRRPAWRAASFSLPATFRPPSGEDCLSASRLCASAVPRASAGP